MQGGGIAPNRWPLNHSCPIPLLPNLPTSHILPLLCSMTDHLLREKTTVRLHRKIAASVAALTTAVGLATAPTAMAAPAGNIVTIGDSYGANPDQTSYFLGKQFPQLIQPGTPFTGDCQQSHNNWPRKLGQETGAPISDWSCNALTTRTMLGRIDGAIRAGDLHAGTRSVVISVGMNDYGPPGRRAGYNITDHNAIRDAHLRDIRTAADKIRAVNPNIRIVIAGFPTVANAQGGVCVLNVIQNVPMGLPLGIVRDVENRHRQNQMDAARANGLNFVDIRAMTTGHDTCAPDAQRYVSGIIDTTAPHWNMWLHPTDLGNTEIARMLRGNV